MLVSERIGQFFLDTEAGRDRIEYTEYGSGVEWVVLVQGQLIPRSMHDPLARARPFDAALDGVERLRTSVRGPRDGEELDRRRGRIVARATPTEERARGEQDCSSVG